MKTELRSESKHDLKSEVSILIASRNISNIKKIQSSISSVSDLNITINHICNGHSDPLYGLSVNPDILIFWVGENWSLELEELTTHTAADRPPLIICADNHNPSLMRQAMKVGALDFLYAPLDTQELENSIKQLKRDINKQKKQEDGSITAVMNAKGGSGSSFIAWNVADLMSEASNLNVALIGLDIQFGSLSSYLDIEAKYGLIEALDNVEGMDSEALSGYMIKHESGLHLLDLKPGELLMAEDIDIDNLSKLIEILSKNYDQVVIDLPRQIDFITSTVIDKADKLLVVTQQSIAHLHDTQRLLNIFRRDLGVNTEKITIVVNRYEKELDLNLNSISKTLQIKNILTVPNAFNQVSESINGGEPLYSVFKKSAITKSLLSMKDKLIDNESEVKTEGIKGVFGRFGLFKS